MPMRPPRLNNARGITRAQLLIGALAVLLVGGAPSLFLRRQPGPAEKKPEEPPPTTSVELGEFLVNLADKNPPRYLKTEIMLEVTGHEGGGHGGGEGSDPELTRLRDVTLTVLCSHTYEELMGEQGKERLKQELADRITEAVPEMTVEEVLFSSFVMQ